MIELKNIFKVYRSGTVEVKAVDDVSLKIAAGEFVAIMGASGSGKSTLMHILGLLDRPDSGTFLLAGQDITGLSDEQLAALRNRLIGFVFQQFHLLARMTALENAELPLIYAGRRNMQDKVRHELTAVGLADRMTHRPNELSGGQQQRVAIARSLVNDPFIIMADEPTGNLDTKSKDEIVVILKQLNAQGKTIVMVTHEPEMAAHASRVIQMRDGKIISDQMKSAPNATPQENNPVSTVNEVLNSTHKPYELAKFLDSGRQAVYAMVSHKMRSFLSILGILIGVGAVIAMLALGTGAQESIKAQLASLGSNLLIVRAGQARIQGVSQSAAVNLLTFPDLSAVEQVPSVSRVSPSVTGRVQVVSGNKNWNTQVEGVGIEYAPMRASVPVIGRFFTEEELRSRAKVAVLGPTIVKELFDSANPIGETIKINLINFKVIGILPAKGSGSGSWRDQDDTILAPVTTVMYRLLGRAYLESIYVEVASADTMDAVQETITDILLRRHHLTNQPNSAEAFQIRNLADVKASMEATTKTMGMLLGSIAAISLLVGGIGIMNIMLVSVTERTREIGLRKAIGATRRDIMMQFLVESVLMSFIGGISGIILGVGISVLLTFFAGWTVKISLSSIILATTFSLGVGMVFGLWPANQASKFNPIEALRYE